MIRLPTLIMLGVGSFRYAHSMATADSETTTRHPDARSRSTCKMLARGGKNIATVVDREERPDIEFTLDAPDADGIARDRRAMRERHLHASSKASTPRTTRI